MGSMGAMLSSGLQSLGQGVGNLLGPAAPMSSMGQTMSAIGSNPSLSGMGITPNMIMGLGPGSPALPDTKPGFLRAAGGLLGSGLNVLPDIAAGKSLLSSGAPATPAPAMPAPAPATPATPLPTVGAAPTTKPLAALAQYRQFLNSTG